MQNGIAFILNLQRLLSINNMPQPEGLIVTNEMFNQIEEAYPALVIDHNYARGTGGVMEQGKATVIKFHGMKIYRGINGD